MAGNQCHVPLVSDLGEDGEWGGVALEPTKLLGMVQGERERLCCLHGRAGASSCMLYGPVEAEYRRVDGCVREM